MRNFPNLPLHDDKLVNNIFSKTVKGDGCMVEYMCSINNIYIIIFYRSILVSLLFNIITELHLARMHLHTSICYVYIFSSLYSYVIICQKLSDSL